MNSSDDAKRYRDPLLDQISHTKSGSEKARPAAGRRRSSPAREAPAGSSGGSLRTVLVIALAAAIGAMGYFLYQAQDRIAGLSDQLSGNEEQLAAVSADLQSSRSELQKLDAGLGESRSRLQQQGRDLERYKGLYTDLKDKQEHQNLELEALNLEKASRTDVAALRDETTALQTGVQEARTGITELKQTSEQQGARLDATDQRLEEAAARLGRVDETARTNTTEIAAVRRSLEKDYYNFELQEKGSYMKVQEVSFRVTDINFDKRLYDLDVLADGKIIRQRDRAINEPVYFFREGQKKPYEVVVTRIERDLVVGYLAVPKVTD